MRSATSARAGRLFVVLARAVRVWGAGPFVIVSVQGAEHIPRNGPGLVVCNHPSMLNTLIPWALMQRNPAVLVLSHAFAVPGLGHLLRALRNVPVRRDVHRRGRVHRDHRLDRAASATTPAAGLSDRHA